MLLDVLESLKNCLCDTVPEPTVNTDLCCVFCFQNVAVSKSRHRLLFHPIMEKEKEQKKPFFQDILSTGGRL